MITPGFRSPLAAVAAQQGGLVTRQQALAADYTVGEVRARCQPQGPWVVVRRGAYAAREHWECLSPPEQAWLRDVAAHLTMTKAHVLSHDSAARGLGLPLLRPVRELSHISRPGVGGTRTVHGVMHHLARVTPPSVVRTGGVAMTAPARTGLDLARLHGLPAGVVAIDAARRRGATPRDFVRELALMRHWPYVSTARAAWQFSDPGAESPAESLGRILVAELGLGRVFTQFAVDLAGRTVWCDLRVGCHVVEVDGRVKYRPEGRGGYAQLEPEEVVWLEKLREREICAVGLGMSRLVWGDFFGPSRERAKERLLHDYRDTVARYGTTLPDRLERFARQNPRPIRP